MMLKMGRIESAKSSLCRDIYRKVSNFHTKWTGESAKMKVILGELCQ